MARCLVKYLYQNNGGFRFKRPVPKPLRAAFGASVVNRHLKGVKDRAIAEKEVRKLTVQTDELFDSLRRELEDAPRIQAKVTEIVAPLLNSRLIREVATGSGKPDRVAKDKMRAAKTRADVAEVQELLTKQLGGLPKSAIRFNAKFLNATGDIPVTASGLPLQTDIEHRYRSGIETLAALVDGVGAIPLPKAFEKVIDIWRKENPKPPSESAVTECRRAVRYLQQALGEPVPLTALTKQHMRKFRTWLYEYRKRDGEPFAQWSRHKYFGYVKLMLKTANDQDIIETNPAADITMPKASADQQEHDRRSSFSNQQVQKVIAAAIALTESREEDDKSHGWITLIGACTGARLSEIANATPGRFVERDGILCLHIAGRRKAKTGSSVRYLPLPQLVLDHGFKAYMTEDRMKRAALFDYGRAKSFSKAVSKWAGRFLKSLGVKTTKAEVFHSLRHTMKDALREVTPDQELRDRIIGHVPDKVGPGYGAGAKLAKQKATLDKAVKLIRKPVAVANRSPV